MAEAPRNQLVVVGSSAADTEALSKLVLDIASVPLRGAGGNAEGVLCQLTDVAHGVLSRRHAAGIAEKVREEGSRPEAILEGIVDAVLAVDDEGRVLFSNEVFTRRFGHGSVGSKESSPRLGYFVPHRGRRARAARGDAAGSDLARGVRDAVRHPRGERLPPLRGQGHPFPGDGTGRGVVVIREIREG